MQLTSSTDMMLNYVQGELVQPRGKFRALQMDNGNALLFAIDSSDTFNVIRELSGQKSDWMGRQQSIVWYHQADFPIWGKGASF